MVAERIRLPSRLTHDRPDTLSRIVGALISSSRSIELDASGVTFSQPLGVVALEAAALLREHRGLPKPVWIAPEDTEARDYLVEVGFRMEESIGRPSGVAPTDSGTRVAHLERTDVVFVDRAAHLVRERVPGTPDSVAHDIRLALNELTTNAFEHAESPIGCVAQTRWYAKDQNVRIAVADLGVNIVRHLRRRSEFASESARSLLERALTEEGVTGRTSGKFGGLGLKHLSSLVSASHRQGALRVISGGVFAEVTASGVTTRLLDVEVLGTFVELDFRPSIVADDAPITTFEDDFF